MGGGVCPSLLGWWILPMIVHVLDRRNGCEGRKMEGCPQLLLICIGFALLTQGRCSLLFLSMNLRYKDSFILEIFSIV